MAANDGYQGREIVLKIGGIGTAVGTLADQKGVQSKTITRNRSPVDITNDDDGGWRVNALKPGMRSVDLSFNGVMASDNYNLLLNRFYDDANTDHYSLEIIHPAGSGGGTDKKEVGKFALTSLETSGEHNGAVAFSATFESSGAVAIQDA